MLFLVAVVSVLVSFSFTKEEAIKVGFLLDNYDINRWYKDYEFSLEGEAWFKDIDFFSERIDELGGQTIVRVAKGDAERQLKQARELIKMGVKCIVVVASNQDSAATIVREAHQAGVKVIAYDRMINNCEPDYYVAYNIQKIAELQADYIRKNHRRGNIVIINGPKTDINYSLFRKGQMSVLAKYISKGKYNVIVDTSVLQSTTMEAYMLTEEILATKTKEIDIILAADDALATGVIMALEKENLDGKVMVTGQNADLSGCRNIVRDKQKMTIYKPIEALSYAAAIAAMKLSKGEKLSNPFSGMSTRMSGITKNQGKETTVKNMDYSIKALLINPILVDKENIKETVVTDGHLSEEIIYK